MTGSLQPVQQKQTLWNSTVVYFGFNHLDTVIFQIKVDFTSERIIAQESVAYHHDVTCTTNTHNHLCLIQKKNTNTIYNNKNDNNYNNNLTINNCNKIFLKNIKY